MTREEEILNAARTRAERHQIAEMELYGGDKCNYSYGRIYFSEIASFEAGAKWADQHPNNVWHDANEKPRTKEWLLVQFDEDDYDTIYFDNLYTDMWSTWCKTSYVIRWAYISDLLPKQFGNSKQPKGGEQ